jgi:hypothetical protein
MNATTHPETMALQAVREVSDRLYCLAMKWTDESEPNVDERIELMCKQAGVRYPPERMETV